MDTGILSTHMFSFFLTFAHTECRTCGVYWFRFKLWPKSWLWACKST